MSRSKSKIVSAEIKTDESFTCLFFNSSAGGNIPDMRQRTGKSVKHIDSGRYKVVCNHGEVRILSKPIKPPKKEK